MRPLFLSWVYLLARNVFDLLAVSVVTVQSMMILYYAQQGASYCILLSRSERMWVIVYG